MSEREQHDRLADELEAGADRLEDENERLQKEIGEVRTDWERKRADPNVPGAPPRPQDTNRDAPGDEVNPEDAARGAHVDPQTPKRTGPDAEPGEDRHDDAR